MATKCAECDETTDSISENDGWMIEITPDGESRPLCPSHVPSAVFDPETHGLQESECDEKITARVNRPCTPPYEDTGSTEEYECDGCGESFPEKSKLLHHQTQECSDQATEGDTEDSDTEESHEPETEKSDESEGFKCQDCGDSFGNPGALASHRASAHE